MWLSIQFESFKEQTYYTADFNCQIPVQLSTTACIILCGDKSKKFEDFNGNCSEFFSANILIKTVGYFLYSYITYDWYKAEILGIFLSGVN